MTFPTLEYPVAIEQLTKTWLGTLDGINKLQEKNEKLLVGLLEYQKEAREEARRMAEKVIEQVGENQRFVAQMVETATAAMTEAFKVAPAAAAAPHKPAAK